jgi:hypothetical protein
MVQKDIQKNVIAYDLKKLKPNDFNIYWKELILFFSKKKCKILQKFYTFF